jgi:uncharacterized protein (TIGR02466 family)
MQKMSVDEIAAAHLAAGRTREALAAIEGPAKEPGATHLVLACYGHVLSALGRRDECLAVRRLAARRFPRDGIAWHNLASALEDLGAHDEAADAGRKAFAAGLDAPETWLVHARALAGGGRTTDAIVALDQALRRRPGYPDALSDKARLVLAATGDVDKAAAVYPRVPTHAPSVAELHRTSGQPERAIQVLQQAVRLSPADPTLQQSLAALALAIGRDDLAAAAAAAALKLSPFDATSLQTWAVACLATGQADKALAAARRLVQMQPFNQSVLALLAIAARLAGAPEYERLYDYDAFVRAYDIAPPAGWTTIGAFLADLRVELHALHDATADTHDQSFKGGTQLAKDLRVIDSPAIQGFFAAIDPLIRRHIAELGPGADPLRAARSGGHAISGSWSIRLRAGGHHVDHIHPRGWLSSAFYVEVPEQAQDSDGKEGWLQFGRPSLRTAQAVEPAHYVRPVPGRLVMFPSYMWHGTVPFSFPEPRMTIAFDVLPA